MDPYVIPGDKEGTGFRTPNPEQANANFMHGLGRSVDEALLLRNIYLKKSRTHTITKNALALVLVPLSAGALFDTVTADDGDSTDFVTATAIATGAVYGLSSLLISQTRQKIYVEGARALNCAVFAAGPFLIPKPTQGQSCQGADASLLACQYQDYRNAEVAILDGITAVDLTVQTLEGLRRELTKYEAETNATFVTLDANIIFTKAATTNAREVAGRIPELVAELEGKARELDGKVRDINDAVTAQLIETEPNLGAVFGVIGGLELLSGQFGLQPRAGVADLPEIIEEQAQEADEGQAVREAINVQIETLSNQLRDLARFVNRATAFHNRLLFKIQRVGSLDGCDYQPITIKFDIQPIVDSIQLAPGKDFHFTVFGEQRMPSVAVTGAAADQIETQTLIVNQRYTIRIIADEQASPNTDAQVVLSSGIGNLRKTVTVAIVAGGDLEQARTLSERRINEIQRLLGLDGEQVDGQLGSVTCPLVRNALTTSPNPLVEGGVTPDELDELIRRCNEILAAVEESEDEETDNDSEADLQESDWRGIRELLANCGADPNEADRSEPDFQSAVKKAAELLGLGELNIATEEFVEKLQQNPSVCSQASS